MELNAFLKMLAGVGLLALVFYWFYFRNRLPAATVREERKLQQIESKLKSGLLEPAEYEFKVNMPVQWLIHRFDSEPDDEIFEISELEIYELLPAGHTTVLTFLPEKKGKYRVILGTEHEAGVVRIV